MTNVLPNSPVNPALDFDRHRCKAYSSLPKSNPLQIPFAQIKDFPCAFSITLEPLLPIRS